jgi:hypothetical protein
MRILEKSWRNFWFAMDLLFTPSNILWACSQFFKKKKCVALLKKILFAQTYLKKIIHPNILIPLFQIIYLNLVWIHMYLYTKICLDTCVFR